MDSIIIHNPHEPMMYDVQYDGCENNTVVGGIVIDVLPINPFVEPIIWTRQNDSESVTLNADPNGLELNYQWSTGDTTQTIEVSEPGIYSVTIINDCGSATYSVEIRDNVELYRATVDLQTNKNKVIWLVTPEQAQYITSVKIYRDNIPVDTAPYTNGYFLDAIGSDAAARNYRIVGVSVEGDDCPIPSYEKGTIHTTYYEDVDGNLNMTWNTPYIEEGAQGTLTGFQICKYNPATEEVTVIDQVNASITDYTCSSSAFIGGQATIAAIFDSKDTESRSFSNRNTMLAVSENEENHFKVYPNPAKDRVTVEGTGLMTVTNTLGQTILTKEIDGKATIDLPQGLYFVKLGNEMQKIVVE
ncbi:MAG: T9SS type A sorting domain-containing protein [Bacteroidales bacterium]|nr:T9SS type A sorting domain-containing protein [Bacteroidales bacterium]